MLRQYVPQAEDVIQALDAATGDLFVRAEAESRLDNPDSGLVRPGPNGAEHLAFSWLILQKDRSPANRDAVEIPSFRHLISLLESQAHDRYR